MSLPASPTSSAIAIIGMGCRLPGRISRPRELAEFLCRGGDGVREVPADRYSLDLHFDPDDGPNKVYVRHAGFLEQDIFSFDPAPFGISPREADHMDPQQRLLLEVGLEAFEDAGLPVDRLRGSATGVFVGGFMLDTQTLALDGTNRELVSQHTSTGVTMTVLANRISHTFDLRGPSLTVDTACSASMVATHLACQNLASGACDLALAGGANVILTNGGTLIMCKGKFLAPDGRSKAFDAAADGYGRGEGAALVVLKRLEDALRDGDQVYAVIRSTGINQDGRTDGMALPNGDAQAELSASVCKRSGIRPADVAYVEAHGTGTRAGDPIEARALAATYGGERQGPLLLGSIKSNIGHLEAGAGVAALVKVATSIATGTILPQRRLEAPNPDIAFDELGLQVVQEPTAWPNVSRRIAAINSFGYGGTNAHAIVSDVHSAVRDLGLQAPTRPVENPLARFFPFSADSNGSLRAYAAQLATFVEETPELTLTDIAHTLSCGRAHRSLRGVVMATERKTLIAGLRAAAAGQDHPQLVTARASKSRKTMWTFTGMGPQWWGMLSDLESDDDFRATVLEADEHFRRVAGWSILEEMRRGEAESRMARNEIAQPANLIIQVGLIAMMRAAGIRADGYLGHSVGELAAAYAAGCLDLQAAVEIAYFRSQLQQQVAGQGTMLACAVSAERAAALIEGKPVEIAAYNAAQSVALAGERAALEAIAAALTAEGIFARLMPVEVAYHSAQMEPLAKGFRDKLAFLAPSAPTAPLFSTLTGGRIEEAVHNAAYWWANARRPVLLQRAVESALADDFDLFIEIGPQPVLKVAISENLRSSGREGITLHAQHRKAAGCDSLRRLIAAVHANGGGIEARRAYAGRLVDLPRYAFDRAHHWVESAASRDQRLGRPNGHPLLQRRESTPLPRWTSDLSSWSLRWIRDHRVDGRVVFPGAAHTEALLAAAAERLGDGEHVELVLEDLVLEQPLVLTEGEPTTLRVEAELDGFATVSSSTNGSWTRHAVARLHDRSRFGALAAIDLTALRETLTPGPSPEAMYERFAEMGLTYSGSFRAIKTLWTGSAEVLAELAIPEADGYRLHPAVLDGAFQALLSLQAGGESGSPWVPVSIERVRVFRALAGATVFAHGRLASAKDGGLEGDLIFTDADGAVFAEVRGVLCRAVRQADRQLSRDETSWFHGESWHPVAEPLTTPTGSWLFVGADSAQVRALVDAVATTAIVHRVELDAPWPVGFIPGHVVVMPSSAAGIAALSALAAVVRKAAALSPPPRLAVVTGNAYHSPISHEIDPMQTAIVGLSRVAMTEHPALAVRIIDAPKEALVKARQLACSLAATEEEELVVGSGQFLARRIVRTGARNERRRASRRHQAIGEGAVELVAESPGKLDSLTFRPIAEQPLGADEIEVAVEAASLNFKDVMKAMGMLSRTALERSYLGTGLGMEAVGRVLRVGSAVEDLVEGDHVYLWHGGCLASRVRARAGFVFKLPEGVDPLEACCRFVFLTAWHGLLEAGRLRTGERVLIHSAAGGVGLAAIQLARLQGAEIYATAGTEEKRAYLRSLGIEHVYDSRTLDFADQIRADTGGEGVDVVLNALAGPAQRVSLELLRDGGRFVEIGKQDIAAGAKLSLLAFNRALTFAAVDLDRLSSSRSDLCAGLAAKVWEGFASGALHALPTELFSAAQLPDAFRRLGSGAVIGKVAIDFRGATLEVSPGLTPATQLRGDATYLVTGGLGGFGLRTARWLATQGARHLVLASRRGVPQGDDAVTVAALRADGVEVECLALDVSDAVAVAQAIAIIDRPEAPLKGVFHSAMVLDDRPIAALDHEALRRVCAPKIAGALNLHHATASCDLELFVTYSSVSALVGNPGQAAYAAANAFLDGLAAHRRAQGLCALSVSWGALGETGVVARNAEVRRHLETMGLKTLAPARALAALERALREDLGVVGIIDIDWNRWRRATAPTPWLRLTEVAKDEAATEDGAGALASALAKLDAEAGQAMVLERIVAAVCEVLRMPTERIDVERPLKDYGVDSLMAVELQVALQDGVGVEFTTMELLAGRTPASLRDRAIAQLTAASRGAAANPAATDAAASPAATGAAAGVPTEGAALRAYLLDRICVQEPYFALDGLRRDGDWVWAAVTPAPAPEGEHCQVSVAESARHLAILGSCAVRLTETAPGRVYFPVRGADLLELGPVAAEAPVSRARLRARCTAVDLARSMAIAEAELLGDEDVLLARFEITYHVIPDEEFRTLFAAHAQPTHEALGGNPYDEVRPLPLPVPRGEGLEVELGAIDKAECLGHFVGYPAYPVSIMARDAVQLVAEAVRRRDANEQLQVRVVGGTCGTASFVFAGDSASLVAKPLGAAATGEPEAWRVEVRRGGELAAWFDMEVELIERVRRPAQVAAAS